MILYEWAHAYRTIPLDGRPHLAGNIKLYNGDSRGHWEGNTLVVDVTNFNDKVFLDSHGSFYSEALHVVERWTLVDANTLKYEATLEDPTVFTRPLDDRVHPRPVIRNRVMSFWRRRATRVSASSTGWRQAASSWRLAKPESTRTKKRKNDAAPRPLALHDQHRVTVAVESIAAFNRLPVRREQPFPARKGADQHEE